MKNLFQLRRNSKVKYKAKPYKKAPTRIVEPKEPICRIMPLLVVQNLDTFLALPRNKKVHSIDNEAQRTRAALL